MSTLQVSDFMTGWASKLQHAAEQHPAVPFDGRTSLPAWLAESARDQAERVFLVLDGTPVERRDLGWAERFIESSGLAVLDAWQEVMEGFRTDGEPWAKAAATAAAEAYTGRLNELGPSIHAGGAA